MNGFAATAGCRGLCACACVRGIQLGKPINIIYICIINHKYYFALIITYTDNEIDMLTTARCMHKKRRSFHLDI